MLTKMQATIEDLYHVPENGKAEIVNGEIVRMSPTGRMPNRASSKIWMSLYLYEQANQNGIAVADNAGFSVNLPHRESFSPDAAYYTGSDPAMRFFVGAPVFAAEVRSEGDYGPAANRKIAAKRADYFATGAQVIWDVDLLSPNVIRKYTAASPETPTIFRRGEIADAEPAVPGWTMAVDELFS